MLWLSMAVELPAVVEPPLPMGKQCAISPKCSLTGKQDANICVPALRGHVFCVRPICSRQHMPGAVLRVCGGVAAGGIHSRIKNYHQRQNVNKKRVFSFYSDFSHFSLKFPIDFDQIQVRFTSLVNLGIWKGKKKN